MMSMKKSVLSVSIIIAIVLIAFQSCVSHNLDETPFTVECQEGTGPRYSSSVSNIVAQKCALPECHGHREDLPDWTKYDVISNPDFASEIIRRTTLPLSDPDKMPRKGFITQAERDSIVCWVNKGALNN
jgi:hypothetical protein